MLHAFSRLCDLFRGEAYRVRIAMLSIDGRYYFEYAKRRRSPNGARFSTYSVLNMARRFTKRGHDSARCITFSAATVLLGTVQ